LRKTAHSIDLNWCGAKRFCLERFGRKKGKEGEMKHGKGFKGLPYQPSAKKLSKGGA